MMNKSALQFRKFCGAVLFLCCSNYPQSLSAEPSYTCSYSTEQSGMKHMDIVIAGNGKTATLDRGSKYHLASYVVLRNDNAGLMLAAGDRLEIDPSTLEIDFVLVRKNTLEGRSSDFGNRNGEMHMGWVNIDGSSASREGTCTEGKSN